MGKKEYRKKDDQPAEKVKGNVDSLRKILPNVSGILFWKWELVFAL